MILKNILKKKTVSVWGLGYLGYTTILNLQNAGFNVLAYDLNEEQLKQFMEGKYPGRERIASWSSLGYMPKLDYTKIKAGNKVKDLFKESHLHFIAIPEVHKNIGKSNLTGQIADIFSKNLRHTNIAPLIIFESAFIPGHIEKYFIKYLKNEKLVCGKDYLLGAWFRTDWSVEAFISQKGKTPVAGYDAKSLKAIQELFKYFGLPVVELDTLREAEIYVNSMNVIQAMATDFVRQLAFGYPSRDMKKLSELLFKNTRLEDCTLNIGTGGERMTFAIDNLIQGSANSDSMTLLKEFQDINISSVLNYAEYIIRHLYKSVAILGITCKGNQKDLVLSPSITLTDYLLKNSVKVFLNDPFFTEEEVHKLVKGVKVAHYPDEVFSADVLIVASDHNEYKYLSQDMLGQIKKKTRLIIDNYGIWSHLQFGNNIKYHRLGDGKLDLAN